MANLEETISGLFSGLHDKLDDTHLTLIMPSEIPRFDPDKTDLRTQYLIEKMEEAIKDQKKALPLRCGASRAFDTSVPYDIFDFRVSRHRDGPAELLVVYGGHVMADCFFGATFR